MVCDTRRVRKGFALGTGLIAAALIGACSPAPLTTVGPGPSVAPTAQTTASPTAPSGPTQPTGVRAPKDVATTGTVIGTIWLGFEGCVGLTPTSTSPYLPPIGQDDFVLFFPRHWKVVAAHPKNPLFGDHFEVRDPKGHVVARDGDTLAVTGLIRAIEATYCGFGWPVTVRQASRVGG